MGNEEILVLSESDVDKEACVALIRHCFSTGGV